mmetsp:Transcript_27891/g.67562  ORF Transcript_27891/g.67562 Transcript_27891/m.67562 type:complete len:125 (-) Transcript_27891:418-792(-)
MRVKTQSLNYLQPNPVHVLKQMRPRSMSHPVVVAVDLVAGVLVHHPLQVVGHRRDVDGKRKELFVVMVNYNVKVSKVYGRNMPNDNTQAINVCGVNSSVVDKNEVEMDDNKLGADKDCSYRDTV